MKTLQITILGLIIAINASAQCKMTSFYDKGAKLNFEVKAYPEKPSIMMAAAGGAKPKKIVALVEERRELMEKGLNLPTVSSFTMTVEDMVESEDGQIVYVGYELPNGAGKNISAAVCDGKSIFIHRNIEKAPQPDVKAIFVNGVQELPIDMKTGDLLKSYEDAWVTYPEKVKVEERKKVLTGYKKYSEFLGYSQGRVNGQIVTLKNYEEGYKAKYDEVTVELEKTTQATAHIINYAEGSAGETEILEVNGQEFEAIIITSKQWVKSATNVSYASLDKSLAQKKEKKENKSLQKFADAALENMKSWGMDVTEGGYIINTVKEWYVPGMGVLKTQTYDPYNILTSETALVSVE